MPAPAAPPPRARPVARDWPRTWSARCRPWWREGRTRPRSAGWSAPRWPWAGNWPAAAGTKGLLVELFLQTAPRAADSQGMQGTSRIMSSRAVLRMVEPGSSAECVVCGAVIRFAARSQQRQVIANVYQEGTWLRVEHYHAEG